MFHYSFGLDVIFAEAIGGRVGSVTLTGRSDRTPNGVGAGVGTREVVLKARVAGVTCATDNGVLITLGNVEAGQRVTDFFMRNGVVRLVSLGFVFD
jgi:hypothetical protein